jgi:hypothetical protein
MMAATLRNTLLGAAAAIVAGAAAGLLYFRQPPVAASAVRVDAATSAAPAAVRTDTPVAREAGLSDSDPIMLEGMRALIGAVAANQYLEPDEIVRRIVTTVDNLPRRHAAKSRLPIRAQIGGFIATSDDEQRAPLSAENFARYAPYVQLLSALDVRALAQLYAAHSAWFQQAYDELNHAEAPPSFQVRLVQAIDTLLATPDPTGPLLIYRPEASYEFADPDFENLPAGEKLLLRMGPANAALVKGKLRELKAALTTLAP